MNKLLLNVCLLLLLGFALSERALASFGITSSAGVYTVDTGASPDLIFKVNQSSGDVTSLNFGGTEYQATDKNSQIGSGLGVATVTATTYGTNYIKITISTTASSTTDSNLTHYLMVKNGDPIIYMATFPSNEPSVGELRWITRLQWNKLPNGPPQSDNNGNTGAIESTDVFGYTNGPMAGFTTSKYYARHRALELTYTGATGTGVGAWVVFDNRESSACGPFFRDIENQGDGTNSDQEVYNYMNSGHVMTEPWRTNVLYGPYALVFTTGAPPTLPLDYSWIESAGLNLIGWVSATNRGAISGVANGVPAGFEAVVGFANTNAQYWAIVSSNGTYTTPLMKPGTYTAILYKGELGVATNFGVTVTAGTTNILNLASAETAPSYIFRIGEWDGTPAGFMNDTNITNMHPSDVRNQPWQPTNFMVGTYPDSYFPAIQMRGTNSPTTVTFNLTADQIQDLTFRIGITCAYNNGRPQVSVNGTSVGSPGASSQPSSRTFTLGTWRGNNFTFSYNVSSNDLTVGANSLTINPISGSSDLSPWLSAGWVYDAVEMDIPNTGPSIPGAPTSLAAAALNGSEIQLDWTSNSTNEVNFLVERSTDNVNFSLVGAVLTAVTNLTDSGLSPGTTYYYRVRASNAAGQSSYSNVASVTTTVPFIKIHNLGSSLQFTGSGGPQSQTYYLLMSTSLTVPRASWQPVATNQFDINGNFSATNVPTPGVPQQFYILQVP